MTRSWRDEGTDPAAGTHNIPGPSLPAGSGPGNTPHTFHHSLAAAIPTPKDPADAKPGQGEASPRCFMCGWMAYKCCLSKVWLILECLTQCLHASVSVCTNVNKAGCWRRQVLRPFALTNQEQKQPAVRLHGGGSGRLAFTDGTDPPVWSGCIQSPLCL